MGPKQLKKKIEKYLKKRNCLEFTQVYTKKEWNALDKYDYGETADVSLVFDGGQFYSVVSGEFGWGMLTEFTEWLEDLGYFFELGYSWMMNIYRNE